MIEDSYVIAFGNGSSSSVFSDKFVCSVFVDYEFRNLPIMLFIFIILKATVPWKFPKC